MELPRSRTPVHKQSAKFHLKCQEKVEDVGDTESWLTISKLLAYKTNKMNSLKKAIDVMVDKENHPDWEDYQSADTGIDMSGTPVPSIFPEEDELINNPEFKGYAIP